MLAFFYKNFSKRKKSTKVPDAEVQYDTKELVLKENTSEEKPVFIVTGNIETTYNYILWNRNYYFIDDIVSINNSMVEIHCTKDYLATWKPYIQNFQAFVERSESAYDPMLYDATISQNVEIYTGTATTDSFDNTIDAYTGLYVLRTVSQYGIESYAMNKQTLSYIMAVVFDRTHYTTQGQMLTDIDLALFNPFQYIVSLQWFPLPLSIINQTVNPPSAVRFGWYTSNVSALKLNDTAIFSDIQPVTLPTPIYNDFRQYSNNWTEYKINIPSVGVVPLDSASVQNGLRYSYCFDLLGGNFTFLLYDANRIIATYETRGAVDVQIGHYDTSNALSETVGTVQSLFSLQPKGTIDGIHNLMNPTPSVIGSAGSRSKWIELQFLTVSYRTFGTKDDTVFIYGRPTMQYKTIGNLTGFVKTMNAQVDFPCHGDEKDILNSLLDSGFYFE